MRFRYLALGLACLALPASAEPAGDAETGHAFAVDVCADCHDVGAEPPAVLNADIRAFADIAADPRADETWLRARIEAPHSRMPEFHLSETQTADIIAYILSLR